jgi:hypothetical protein
MLKISIELELRDDALEELDASLSSLLKRSILPETRAILIDAQISLLVIMAILCLSLLSHFRRLMIRLPECTSTALQRTLPLLSGTLSRKKVHTRLSEVKTYQKL